MRVMFTAVSQNKKLGPMATSITDPSSCPPACPLKGSGCYAEYGPLGWMWKGVAEGRRGRAWESFLEALRALPRGRLFRHNQAGDLPGRDNLLDRERCLELADAASHLNAFTYTHYPSTEENLGVLREMKEKGFVVNLSADSMKEADELAGQGLPVVAVVPGDARGKLETPAGLPAVICPAVTLGVQCVDCKLCFRGDRKVIVAFPAHGAGKRKVESVCN